MNKIKQAHLTFLDKLRSSGKTNMFGAVPFLVRQFKELSQNEASEILSYWMENFDEEGTKLKE